MTAKRYNTGKLGYHLFGEHAMRKIAEVYSRGAHKYSEYEINGERVLGKDIPFELASQYEVVESGVDNWRKGQVWLDSIGSVLRHIELWKSGEDYDELQTHHLANAAWGLMALLEYSETHPELDNRRHWFKQPIKKVFMDLDGVICDFEKHFIEYLDLPHETHTDWNDPVFRTNFHKIESDEEFWLSLPPIIDPIEITYPISGYCTSRSVPTEITQKWLDTHKFPRVKLISLGLGESKLAALKEAGCEVMIDDSITNFMELQSNGILCYLKTRPHNTKYDVGIYRVDNVAEFFNKIKNLLTKSS